jgi:UrcA family protein
MKVFAIVLLAAAAVAVPVPAGAQPGVSNSVSVVGHAGRHHVRTIGPDGNGRYELRVNIADLNAASDKGWHAMQSRVERGSAELCSVAEQGPKIAGFYDSGNRQCRRDTRAAAQAQMMAARDAAREGRTVASLAINTAL